MSEWAERRIVLAALRKVGSQSFADPHEVAKATPEFRGVTAHGRAQAMGERRVRKLLAELVEEGYAERRRTYYRGHQFRVTSEGVAAL